MVAAGAIGVGLVFITWGIGSSLNAVARLERLNERARLAELALTQAEAQQFRIRARRAETFPAPDAAYRWELQVTPATLPADIDADAFSAVTLTVRRSDDERAAFSLQALWPTDWVSP